MKKADDLHDKRLADQQTALLALAGKEHPNTKTALPCPEPEKIACLVEGKLTHKEQRQLFVHLSRCASCYRQWLDLTCLLDADKKKARIFPFAHKTTFTFIGSALAAAASVAVFINITTSPNLQDQALPKPSLKTQSTLSKQEPAAPAPDLPAEQKSVEVKTEKKDSLESGGVLRYEERMAFPEAENSSDRVTAPTAGAVKSRSAPELIVKEQTKPSLPIEEKPDAAVMTDAAAPLLQGARKTKTLGARSDISQMSKEKRVQQSAPRSFDYVQWLEDLQVGCREKLPVEFWKYQLRKIKREPSIAMQYPEIIKVLESLEQGRQVEADCQQLANLIERIGSH